MAELFDGTTGPQDCDYAGLPVRRAIVASPLEAVLQSFHIRAALKFAASTNTVPSENRVLGPRGISPCPLIHHHSAGRRVSRWALFPESAMTGSGNPALRQSESARHEHEQPRVPHRLMRPCFGRTDPGLWGASVC